jgi:hypothetical protein
MLEVIANGLKDFSLSSDGTTASFSLTTQYTEDIRVTLPVEHLGALQLRAERSAEIPGPLAQLFNATNDSINTSVRADVPGGEKAKPMPVSVPKRWGVRADKQRGMVVLIVDPDTLTQNAFAFRAGAARELAAAITTQADAVAASQPTKPA